MPLARSEWLQTKDAATHNYPAPDISSAKGEKLPCSYVRTGNPAGTETRAWAPFLSPI